MKKILLLLLMLSSGLFAQAPLVHKIAKAKTNFVTPIQSSLVNEPNCVFAMNGTKIGNTVVDISGNGNTGTAIGGVVASGGIENGLQFNGTSSYVSVADANSLDFDGVPFTVEFILPNVGNGRIIEKGTNGLDIFMSSNVLYFNKSDVVTWTSYSLASYIGKRAHIFMGWDGSNAFIYVDGVRVYYAARTTDLIQATSSALNIGKKGTAYYQGNITLLKLYNVALTSQQVKDKWNQIAKKPYIIELFDDYQLGAQ